MASEELAQRLQARRREVEAAVLARVYGVSDPRGLDPLYLDGLRSAVSAAVDYALAAVELGEDRCPPPPLALREQARLAAVAGVGLDTVLRRYFAGYSLIADFLVEELGAEGRPASAELQNLLRSQSTVLDRLLAAVSEEYVEAARGSGSGLLEQRRSERIDRLLAGELVDAGELAYDLQGYHLGLIATGSDAEQRVRELADALDRRLLLVRREADRVWAWIGGRRKFDLRETCSLLRKVWAKRAPLAIGEPGNGLAGWRLTHLQAEAAFPVAMRRAGTPVWYAEVALLASLLQDELLATSLRTLFLDPLEQERDGGKVARETLRAYFEARGNVSSAAAALEVNRHTVSNRLRAIEERLNRPIGRFATEIETALRLRDFTDIVAH